MPKTPPASAWWSDSGPDDCDFCTSFYYREVGYHCIECDRPICPICVTTVFEVRGALCPECIDEHQREKQGEN